ncbi:hypothetical protein BSKO_10592 [Bryopsis sp. KO-2023]|nr:hypothetical protein BSKO_10592 [Bryopsis sp. KO-2023]
MRVCGGHRFSPLPIRHARGNSATRAINNGGVTDRLGVVVVDHGSRKAESNRVLDSVVELMKQRTGRSNVHPAHMEIAAPTILDAVHECAKEGAETVVVTPYFLSRGRHIMEDLPRLVEEAQKTVPGVKCILAQPLGLDPGLIDIMDRRIDEALVDSMAETEVAKTETLVSNPL